MDPLSTPKLVLKRLADSRALVVSILLGIVAATTLAAMAPTFFAALERLALNLEIDELRRPASNVNLDLFNIVLGALGGRRQRADSGGRDRGEYRPRLRAP